jgi:hypothetical protein
MFKCSKPETIAQTFIDSDKPFKSGNYISSGMVLTYNTIRERVIPTRGPKHLAWLRENDAKGIIQIMGRLYEDSTVTIKGLEQDVIAIRIERDGKQVIIGNSSALGLIGRKMAWGKEKLNRGETEIQKFLGLNNVPMIPFSVFQQAHLDIKKMRIIERGPEETAKRKDFVYDKKKKENVHKIVEVHFTGATLFEVDGNYFLFDIDRREQEHGIFNPFLVKLPSKAKSIEDAYELLKPLKVLQAEADGLTVLRQGEWFFIPVPKAFQSLEPDRDGRTGDDQIVGRGENAIRRLELRAGRNRPNYADEGIEKLGYVRGKIMHSGREHADLVINSWHEAVPNTAIESFTITGDID